MDLMHDNLLVERVDMAIDSSGIITSTEPKILPNVVKVLEVPPNEIYISVGDTLLVKNVITRYELPNDKEAWIVSKDYVIAILEGDKDEV